MTANVLRAVRDWWEIERYNDCSPAGRELRARLLGNLVAACSVQWSSPESDPPRSADHRMTMTVVWDPRQSWRLSWGLFAWEFRAKLVSILQEQWRNAAELHESIRAHLREQP